MKVIEYLTPAFPHSTLQSPKHYIVANDGVKGLEHTSDNVHYHGT